MSRLRTNEEREIYRIIEKWKGYNGDINRNGEREKNWEINRLIERWKSSEQIEIEMKRERQSERGEMGRLREMKRLS